MFWMLVSIMIVLEVALMVLTIKKGQDIKIWRQNRLMMRITQLLLLVLAWAITAQRWRFIPAVVFLAAGTLLSLIICLTRRHSASREKKKSLMIIGCLIHAVLITGLLIPVKLFTNYNGLPVSGDYKLAQSAAILVDHARVDPFEKDGSHREVPIHLYYPVVDALDHSQFPLVVFSHGAFGYYQSNTSTYMNLASYGYIVVALDHPHHAFFTKDTAGKTIIVDQTFLNDALTIDDKDIKTCYKLYQDWMSVREGDMNFVLDTFKRARTKGEMDDSWYVSDDDQETITHILQHMDLSKIGLMGHSMGGATSVALGRERDDISAVIDIDGTMLSEYQGVKDGEFIINEQPYDVPVLEFVNWKSYNQLQTYLKDGGRYPNDLLMRNAKSGYTTTVRDTEHMDFTDLPLFSPFLGHMLGSGKRDTKDVMMIVNDLIVKFYDCYLKGEGDFTVQDAY